MLRLCRNIAVLAISIALSNQARLMAQQIDPQSGSAAVPQDFDANADFDHTDLADFDLPFEFYDNQDAITHGNRDGFRAIEGVIPAAGVVQAGGAGTNVTSVTIDWAIHNDLGPQQNMEDVWIVWEFADDPNGPLSGNKFFLQTSTHAHQTHIAPGPGDGCYVPAQFVAAKIRTHQTVFGSTTFTCDIPVGPGTLGEWLLARQGTGDDVLFNKADSTAISHWPQHIGQDTAGGAILAPDPVAGAGGTDTNSNVSVWFKVKPVPAASTWGAIAMAVLVLAAATVVIVRRRRMVAA